MEGDDDIIEVYNVIYPFLTNAPDNITDDNLKELEFSGFDHYLQYYPHLEFRILRYKYPFLTTHDLTNLDPDLFRQITSNDFVRIKQYYPNISAPAIPNDFLQLPNDFYPELLLNTQNVSGVNTTLSNIYRSNKFWKNKYMKDFGFEYSFESTPNNIVEWKIEYQNTLLNTHNISHSTDSRLIIEERVRYPNLRRKYVLFYYHFYDPSNQKMWSINHGHLIFWDEKGERIDSYYIHGQEVTREEWDTYINTNRNESSTMCTIA